MAFEGFGKNSGPSFPPRSPTLFGSFATTAAVTTTSNPPFSNEPEPMHPSPLQQQQQQQHHQRSTQIQGHQQFNSVLNPGCINVDEKLSPPRTSDYHAPKRTRSPPMQTSNDVSTSQFDFHDLDAEREMHAKAKRLARFGAELSQSVQNLPDSKCHKSSVIEHNQSQIENMKVAENDSKTFTGGFQDRRILPDSDSQDPSTAIVGLCQDMCPESEREERERKGDLDQYERLDGERNQTSKSLAVKKYNRMAEREAALIRPMPILQKTIDYLLEITNQPYSYKFLGMYNFLWDRMRAIRMDLRMQHIFNQHAIIMLEQMIRLHIIAMHELCEYNKGEGFSEGFDAHLNIEQMNKTSVELFQIYDDHRKKGINILTEKEFRGYYALLKLDKHPGYKVEPAELSLDLARMTPEIRGSQEVLFARDVARACRMGNFITFFRLARKATYLQACLMHAHFAKLRTHALASLHSGLQNNQGIPVSLVVKWLGMEEEDIDDLIQHHGFAIKMFEDVYMVKEKPFLNSDVDYPTKCSKLAHSKKSPRIVDDVASGPVAPGFSRNKTSSSDLKDNLLRRASKITAVSARNDFADAVSKVPARSDLIEQFSHRITDNLDVSSLEAKFIHKATSSEGWTDTAAEELQNDSVMKSMEPIETSTSTPKSEKANFEVNNINGLFPVHGTSVMKRVDDQLSYSNESTRDEFVLTLASPKRKPIQIQAPGKSGADFSVKSPKMQKETYHLKEAEEVLRRKSQQHEAVMRKLKIILRKWKANASKKREIREERLLLANLALSSISLGPSLRQNENHQGHAGQKFDIGYIMRERDDKCGKSLSRLNVAGVVGPVLITKNHTSRCLCWKLLLCHYRSDMVHKADERASTWLVSKLMGSGTRDEDELVHLSPGLSIWKKLIDEVPNCTKSICFSVIREVLFDSGRGEHSDLMVGANAIVYLLSESTPYEIQQNHLRSLLLSIPSGSRLPLLILSYRVQMGEVSSTQSVISMLDLLDADNTRVSCVSVVFLSGDCPEEHPCGGFLSDSNLRKGLQWLADQSPLQPTLHLVKTRDLVLKNLGSSLKLINNMKISSLDPDHCIAIFNEALQKTANQVRSAAYMSPNGWPCPEINLIKGSSIEKRVIETFLPKTGWSLEVRIKPIVAAICGCKLPSLSDSLPWLSQGSYMGKEILEKKLCLEKYLSNYLMESAEIISGDLALKEAHLMVQSGAVLELQGSYYHIVPRWLMIFQRIYNWRLMRLVGRETGFAYVLNHDEPFANEIDPNDLMSFQGYGSRGDGEPKSQYDVQLNLAPLDEMIEVACCFPSNELPASKEPPERDAETPEMVPRPSENDKHMDLDYPVSRPSENHKDIDLDYPCKPGDGFFSAVHERELSPVAPLGGYDRLRSLLEKCNMLQNSMAKKLSIYF